MIKKITIVRIGIIMIFPVLQDTHLFFLSVFVCISVILITFTNISCTYFQVNITAMFIYLPYEQ